MTKVTKFALNHNSSTVRVVTVIRKTDKMKCWNFYFYFDMCVAYIVTYAKPVKTANCIYET